MLCHNSLKYHEVPATTIGSEIDREGEKHNIMKRLFYIVAFVGIFAFAAFVTNNATVLTLRWAPLVPQGQKALPPVLDIHEDAPPIRDVKEWEELGRKRIKTVLQREIYGMMPKNAQTSMISRQIIDEAAYEGLGIYIEYKMSVAPEFNDRLQQPRTLTMAVVIPKTQGPHPVILIETFCPRWITLPHPAASKPDGASSDEPPEIIQFVFGRYNCTPPIKEILKAGFALAVVNATDFVPDKADSGLSTLAGFGAEKEDQNRWGAIAAWAWIYSRMVDILEDEPMTDNTGIIAYGHSRYGKSALLAAAFDERIDAVIAHQSGTGGASLNRKKVGESISNITQTYPHWFTPAYVSYAGREDKLTFDQHHLLALIAPRPLLLGNARRDVWSDPNGAFKAAQGALPVYALYGADNFKLDRLDQYKPDAAVAFWMRPGTHGTVEEDWPAFLEFLKYHFPLADRRGEYIQE